MSVTTYLVSLDLIMIPVLLVALALSVGWLANRDQPSPDFEHWAWTSDRTAWKKTVL